MSQINFSEVDPESSVHSTWFIKGDQEREKQKQEGEIEGKQSCNLRWSLSLCMILQGALVYKLHHRTRRELVNYPTEVVQPEGKGVSFPAPKLVIDKRGAEGGG